MRRLEPIEIAGHNDSLKFEKVDDYVNFKAFLKEYIPQCLRLAFEEYRMDSAFNIFQPRFILSLYKKELRRYGIRSSDNSYYKRSVRENEVKEDALSMAADVSSLFVIEHPFLFSRKLIDEARAILNRQDQYLYEDYLLGFGYFLKRVCINGKYATKAIENWSGENISTVFEKLQLSLDKVEIVSDSPNAYDDTSVIKCISLSINIQYPNSVATRSLRLNSCDLLETRAVDSSTILKLLDVPLIVNTEKLLKSLKTIEREKSHKIIVKKDI